MINTPEEEKGKTLSKGNQFSRVVKIIFKYRKPLYIDEGNQQTRSTRMRFCLENINEVKRTQNALEGSAIS